MEQFFTTFYYWTNFLYSLELDNFLYQTKPGYVHVGLVMIIVTALASVFFYYLFKPVRRQNFWWFVTAGVAAAINFLFAIWYTVTPLINNEIDPNDEWTILDSVFFSVSNAFWSFVFFVVVALIIKWKSTCKYVPFGKF